MPHISLTAQAVFHLGSFAITNALLTALLVTVLLVSFSFLVTRRLNLVPSPWQNLGEAVLEPIFGLGESIAGEKVTRFFPLVATFFLFILFGNWFGLIPGVGSLGFRQTLDHKEAFIPLFRGPTADLNTTLALALVSVGAIQYFGLKFLSLPYLMRFFNLRGPVDFFVGILELISDFAKVISFSFRLFGNIFAGEVLLVVMSFLIPVLVPLPFLFLEIFVGFIQAFIFAILTLVFLNVATAGHEEGG